jgi:hypothetical protein
MHLFAKQCNCFGKSGNDWVKIKSFCTIFSTSKLKIQMNLLSIVYRQMNLNQNRRIKYIKRIELQKYLSENSPIFPVLINPNF